jgi:hypothetical protein
VGGAPAHAAARWQTGRHAIRGATQGGCKAGDAKTSAPRKTGCWQEARRERSGRMKGSGGRYACGTHPECQRDAVVGAHIHFAHPHRSSVGGQLLFQGQPHRLQARAMRASVLREHNVPILRASDVVEPVLPGERDNLSADQVWQQQGEERHRCHAPVATARKAPTFIHGNDLLISIHEVFSSTPCLGRVGRRGGEACPVTLHRICPKLCACPVRAAGDSLCS